MAEVIGTSSDPARAGVEGDNTANGPGVWGSASPSGRGVVGVSTGGAGVWGATATGRAVVGAADTSGAGVWGETQTGTGVVGVSRQGRGMSAGSQTNTGVFGESRSGRGVEGYSETNYGVYGQSREFPGVRGTSTTGRGVEGWSTSNAGSWGLSESGPGLEGSSVTGDGVLANSKEGNGISSRGGHTGIYAAGRVNAGYFDGNVHVQGDVSLSGNMTVSGDIFINGADYAEQLTASSPVDPGTVVVLDDAGEVKPCGQHHDPRVAGIVSGAQGVRPAFVLDRHEGGAPIALLGKAWCRADATEAAIKPGDLLTTSSTPGHARRAGDEPAPGTVIGKALTPLLAGRGWVHVFVCRA